jgi:hypothetical protein
MLFLEHLQSIFGSELVGASSFCRRIWMPKYLCECGFVGTHTHNVPIDELEKFGVTFFVDKHFHIRCCGVKHTIQLHVVTWRR